MHKYIPVTQMNTSYIICNIHGRARTISEAKFHNNAYNLNNTIGEERTELKMAMTENFNAFEHGHK